MALTRTTAGTLIVAWVPGATPDTIVTIGNSAMYPVVKSKLDLMCTEVVIQLPKLITKNLDSVNKVNDN